MFEPEPVEGFRSSKRREFFMVDQTLYCRDCNQEFTFTVGEQEFYASRGLTNTPSRCPECRAARKQSGGYQSRGGGSGSSRGGQGGGYREERQMYTATCASCGKEAQVPFQPREDRPVYCQDCYQPRGSQRSGAGRSRW
jgi:CxxC-x17-CxxC domain-containing protein